jgi:hypothetical protein
MVYVYSPSYLGDWNRRITYAQEVGATQGNIERPLSQEKLPREETF